MPKTNIKSEIDTLTKELERLDAKKCSLESTARKILKEIAVATEQIEKSECEAEKALKDKLEKECRERIQCGIERLKQEQRAAHAILCRYDQNLKLKYKMMKGCQHDKQICQCKVSSLNVDDNEVPDVPMSDINSDDVCDDVYEEAEVSDDECPETVSECSYSDED